MKKISIVIISVISLVLSVAFAFGCTKATEPAPPAAPVISQSGGSVVWQTVDGATGYDVYIDGEKVASVTTTSYKPLFEQSGAYQINVKTVSVAGVSDYSNSISFVYIAGPQKLATPELSTRRGVVEWTEVPHATSYEVYMDGELQTETANNWYVMPELADGDYIMTVKAKSTDTAYLTSDLSAPLTYTAGAPFVTPIKAPVLKLEGNIVSWTAVEYADSYEVYVKGALVATLDASVTSYTVDETDFGSYSIKVRATTTDEDHTDSPLSAEVVYILSKPKLATPTISLTGATVTWKAVPNATSYDVYINNAKKASVTELSYTIIATEKGSYIVKIMAKASNYENSAFSNMIEYRYVPPPVAIAAPVISANGNDVTWTAVQFAVEYEIYINDELKTTVTSAAYTFAETVIGNYSLKVVAVPDDEDHKRSGYSNTLSFIVAAADAVAIDTPVADIAGTTVSWQAIEHASGYSVYCNGTLIGSSNTTSFSLAGIIAAGTYSITVVALADDPLHYKNSLPSEPKTYEISKVASHMEKLTDPVKTVYYTDEAATLDLAGLTAQLRYKNSPDVDPVTLTAADITSSYSLTTEGRYELTFAKDGIGGVIVRIYVRKRAAADVSPEIKVYNELDPSAAEYTVTDASFTPTQAIDASGNAHAVTAGKIAASALHEGENLLKLTDGTDNKYALVVVARYITDATSFMNIKDAMDGYYVLCNDIDLSGKNFMLGSAPLWMEWEDEHAKKASKVYATSSGTGSEDRSGELFTGTLDGRGYIISGYTRMQSGAGYSQRWRTSGTAIFGGVGKTGCIKNIALRNITVKATGAAALLAGYNLGLIENICIEEGCLLGYDYDGAAGICAYNFGTVRNVVSHTTTTICRDQYIGQLYLVRFGSSDYSVDNGINGFVGESADRSDILGENWHYIAGLGNFYGNEYYKKVLEIDDTWYVNVPTRIRIFHAKAGLGGSYVHAWGDGSRAVPKNALTSSGSNYTTLVCTLEYNYTAGTALTVKILFNDTGAYFYSHNITVGEPYAVSAADGTDGTVTAYQGGIILLSDVAITLTMSDGNTQSVAPTGYDAATFDSSAAIGNTQSVKFYYDTGERVFETNINITIATPPSAPYARSLTIAKSADEVRYASDVALDLDSVLTFTVTLTDDNTQNVTLAGSGGKLTVSATAPGHKTLTFTYTDPVSNIPVYADVTLDIIYVIKSVGDWKLMNTYLDGYFELQADLTFTAVETNNPFVIGKLPLTATNGVDATGVGSADTQLGVAFTGKFNGNGYKLIGLNTDYTKNTNDAPWASTSYGLVPFAFVGEGGVVENFTLYDSHIKCGQSGSFIVGLNKGTVRNILIDGNCSLIINYGGDTSGAIADTNDGTISNVVCRVLTFTGHGNSTNIFKNTVYNILNNKTPVDCYINATADIIREGN